jgi:glycosyltransferase involved in cell wall biosynthesis
MKVCHVWDRFWPIDIGGLERYILWLTSYLSKTQHINFSLITGRTKILLVTKNIRKYEDAGFLKVYRLGPTPVDLINGACIYSLGFTPDLVGKMKFASLSHEAAQQIGAQSADVFHIHGVWKDLEYINLGIYLSHRFQKPLVMTLHGGFVGDPKQGGMPLESPPVRKILENDVAAITTYSKEILTTLQRLGLGKKSHYITNFLDTPHFYNPIAAAPRDPTVIYVGRLEPVQTPELVIRAFHRAHQKYPNAKLILVGYGTLFESLKNLAKTLGLKDAVSLVGKQTDVRPFLWRSDVFVATNFGYIATLEAMSAGLTVVAPNFGILKEVISDGVNGLLVKEHDVDQLAEALIRLLGDESYRKALSRNAFEGVKSYDIRVIAPKMAEVYGSVALDAS